MNSFILHVFLLTTLFVKSTLFMLTMALQVNKTNIASLRYVPVILMKSLGIVWALSYKGFNSSNLSVLLIVWIMTMHPEIQSNKQALGSPCYIQNLLLHQILR